MLLHVLVLLAPLAAAFPAAASPPPAAVEPPVGGWHWYRDPPPEPEPSPEPDPPSVQAPAAAAESAGAPGPAAFSSAWIRQQLPQVLDKAIENPTPENVRAYLYLNRLNIDRATRFQEVASAIIAGDPLLDENARAPISAFGREAAKQAALEAQSDVLRDLSDEAGVFFFYRSDCPYCHAQAPVLEFLARETGFRVIAVAMDGLPLPGGEFPNYVVDRGQSEKLGVRGVPAMFLVRPPEDAIPIGQGLLPYTDVVERMVNQAHASGWITDEQFDRVRAIRDISLDPGVLAGVERMTPIDIVTTLQNNARNSQEP